MFKVVVVCALAAALSGCVSQAEQQRQAAEATQKQEAFCKSIGAKPGSDAYVNCRLQMRREAALAEEAEVENSRAMGRALSATGAAMMQPAPYSPPRQVFCNSSTINGYTTTTCN